MKKEKVITNLCCVLACLLEWAAVIAILVVLRMNFNYFAGIILCMLWLGTCRLIKKRVHRHYHKSPDEEEATKLEIPIDHFRKIKEADEKVMAIYKQYGFDSAAANKEVDKVLATLPNLEEWRRYEDYKVSQTVDKMQSMTESLFNGTFDKDE